MGWHPPSPKTRFISKIDFHSSPIGCWIWKGSHGGSDISGKQAYGRFFFMEKNVMAYKFSYEFIAGYEIPKGYQIDHLCKNPRCVNPNHLEAVTPQENYKRCNNPMGINSRKTHCVHGHELTGKNLYIAKNGTRKCYACIRIRGKKDRELKKKSQPPT